MEAKAKFAINIIPYFAQTKDLPCIQSGTPSSFPCMEQLINWVGHNHTENNQNVKFGVAYNKIVKIYARGEE